MGLHFKLGFSLNETSDNKYYVNQKQQISENVWKTVYKSGLNRNLIPGLNICKVHYYLPASFFIP